MKSNHAPKFTKLRRILHNIVKKILTNKLLEICNQFLAETKVDQLNGFFETLKNDHSKNIQDCHMPENFQTYCHMLQ